MKDAKEVLYCMGQMADKCLTSLSAIQKDYNEFIALVKRMREAQEEWVSQPSFKWGDTSLFNTLRKLEFEVDEWLKNME